MNRVSTRPAWVLVGVGCLLAGGCKKQPSEPAGATLDAGAPSADAGLADAGLAAENPTPFVFKDVEISRTDQKVKLTYTLMNQGGRRARSTGCLWLHDREGVFIEHYPLGPLSLRGGESDTFEDIATIPEQVWKQARSVQLFAANYCFTTLSGSPLSPKAHLDMKGHPMSKEAPAPRMREEPADGAVLFAISDVGLSQEASSDPVVVHFKVKNTSTTRAAGNVCVRLYDVKDGKQSIDDDASENFNLAAGDLLDVNEELSLTEDKHWNSTVSIKAYATRYGCVDKVEEALSNVVELDKPEDIHAPREEEEETDMDESDGDDPAEEFRPSPDDTDDAGTDAGE